MVLKWFIRIDGYGMKYSWFSSALLLYALLMLSGCLNEVHTSSTTPATPFVRISPTQMAQFEGRVVRVSDGDSMRIVDNDGRNRRIRIAFVDAPEALQAGGKASTQALRAKLLHQTVQVSVIDQDRYGRDVAAIGWQGEDIGLWQIRQGQAWHYQSIARRQQVPSSYATYDQAQQAARQARRGLWRQHEPMAPWLYRRTAQNATP